MPTPWWRRLLVKVGSYDGRIPFILLKRMTEILLCGVDPPKISLRSLFLVVNSATRPPYEPLKKISLVVPNISQYRKRTVRNTVIAKINRISEVHFRFLSG